MNLLRLHSSLIVILRVHPSLPYCEASLLWEQARGAGQEELKAGGALPHRHLPCEDECEQSFSRGNKKRPEVLSDATEDQCRRSEVPTSAPGGSKGSKGGVVVCVRAPGGAAALKPQHYQRGKLGSVSQRELHK